MATTPSYTTRPALLKSPWRFLTTSYGINREGEVYVRRSILGIPFGDRPTVPVEKVTRAHAKGTIFGDVVFGEGSHDPVTWKSVFLPESKLRNARAALKAVRNAQEQWEREEERFRNPPESSFESYILLYPHIPKTVHQILAAIRPRVFDAASLHAQVRVGDVVRKGDVVATYGDMLLTSPHDGRVEMLGDLTPGIHEWPGIGLDYSDETTGKQGSPDRIPIGQLPLDVTHMRTEVYSFGLRPFKSKLDRCPIVRWCFDHGSPWLDRKRKRGWAMYSVIDLAAFACKGGPNKLNIPRRFLEDSSFTHRARQYWTLINNAEAAREPVAAPNGERD